ncbi:T9SS type A sorting domain-containing protein [Flavobacterium sp. FlaQc-52]|uniref:T9SS type A sorting domain-containing protein n=1 Tax=Flavobacterium sp. FlaQc-52 TaxID=3374185 RepID=UPI003757E47B
MKKFYLLLLLFLSLKLLAQNPGLDPTFNPKDDGVYQQKIGSGAVLLPNNKILSVYKNGQVECNVLLLNPDGSRDNTFNTTASFSSKDIRIFAKSDGAFLTLDYSGKLKAFHADGTVNAGFTITTIKNTNTDTYRINDIIYQEDGKIILYGAFDTLNDVYAVGFVRLNADGSLDPTFKWKSAGKKIVIQNDGNYVAVGGTRPSRYFADGKMDSSFKIIATIDPVQKFVTNGFETADNSTIDDIAVQPDGKVIAVGCNYVENGRTISYSIVRLNANGTRDTGFKLFTDREQRIRKVYIQKDNKIILNIDYYKFIRLNPDGSTDPTFKYTNTVGFLNEGVLHFQGDKIIISARFKDSQGITRADIHRINVDGSLDLTFNPHSGPNLFFNETSPFLSKVLLDQKVLLVGNFTTYNDIPVRNICRLNQNGTYDPSFKLDPKIRILADTDSSYRILEQKDGKIILVHNGTLLIDGRATSIIRLKPDGTIDPTFNIDQYVSYNPSDIQLLNNGKILMIGENGVFINTGGSYYSFNIIQLNSDGSLDNGYKSVQYKKPFRIAPLSDNKVLVSFLDYNPNYTYYPVLKLNEDGTKDSSFKSGIYPYSKIKELHDGKLLITYYDRYRTGPNGEDLYLTRVNSDGLADPTFSTYSFASSKVNRSDFYENGEINLFLATNATDSTKKVTLSSDGKLANSTTYNTSKEFAIQNCEDLLFYGYFDKLDGVNKSGIVRYKTSNSTSSSNPAGEIYQPFTNGQTLADLKVDGTALKWYTLQSNCGINNNTTNKSVADTETLLPSTTLLVNGTTYYASQSINGTESSYRLPVTVYSATLGVKENNLPNLVTYPNPVKEYYTISNREDITEVQVYNILGQLQFSRTYNKNSVEIDFTALKSGLYFVKVYSEGKSDTLKVIKN